MNEGRLYIIYMRVSDEGSAVAVVYAPQRPLLSGNQFFPPKPLLAPVWHDRDGEKVTELNGIASLESRAPDPRHDQPGLLHHRPHRRYRSLQPVTLPWLLSWEVHIQIPWICSRSRFITVPCGRSPADSRPTISTNTSLGIIACLPVNGESCLFPSVRYSKDSPMVHQYHFRSIAVAGVPVCVAASGKK
jgi:hypothetical protein